MNRKILAKYRINDQVTLVMLLAIAYAYQNDPAFRKSFLYAMLRAQIGETGNGFVQMKGNEPIEIGTLDDTTPETEIRADNTASYLNDAGFNSGIGGKLHGVLVNALRTIFGQPATKEQEQIWGTKAEPIVTKAELLQFINFLALIEIEIEATGEMTTGNMILADVYGACLVAESHTWATLMLKAGFLDERNLGIIVAGVFKETAQRAQLESDDVPVAPANAKYLQEKPFTFVAAPDTTRPVERTTEGAGQA